MKLTGSQIFVEVLVEQGVDTLFGYPGGAVLNLYDELYKNSDRIRHVLTAHEQGASHAADGYARATGRAQTAMKSGAIQSIRHHPEVLRLQSCCITAESDLKARQACIIGYGIRCFRLALRQQDRHLPTF